MGTGGEGGGVMVVVMVVIMVVVVVEGQTNTLRATVSWQQTKHVTVSDTRSISLTCPSCLYTGQRAC